MEGGGKNKKKRREVKSKMEIDGGREERKGREKDMDGNAAHSFVPTFPFHCLKSSQLHTHTHTSLTVCNRSPPQSVYDSLIL